MKTKTLLLLLTSVIFLVSCQKEMSFEQGSGQNGGNNNPGGTGNNNNNNNQNKSIEGEWDFVGLSSYSEGVITTSQSGMDMKAVTIADYDSKDNSGTLKITATEFTYEDISYRIETTLILKMYMNGALLTETNQPWDMVSPPVDFSSTYTRNNSDSITIDHGTMLSSDPTTSPTQTGPIGMRIAWAGDTLILRTHYILPPTVNGSVPGTRSGVIKSDIKLKKK